MTFFFRFVICLLFSCKFGRRFPKMLSLEQTENGKANKPRDTLRFSQENSKNCHVQATCSLGSFFLWQTQMTEKVIFKLHRIVCVSLCMQISSAYIITLLLKVAKLNKNHFFFSLYVLNAKAAEVELHDPAACCECEQEQACVALKGFIRRKKTQLQFQTLKERLNMHSGHVSG